jgi:hypothetical protein
MDRVQETGIGEGEDVDGTVYNVGVGGQTMIGVQSEEETSGIL